MFDMKTPFDPAMFGDVTKMFDPAKFGEMDQNAFVEMQRKNFEALTTAHQIAMKGYQDIFEKQVAIFQDTMSAAQGRIAEMSKAPSATDAASTQAKLAQDAYEEALANINLLAEMAQKANTEAFEVVKARVEASVKEMQSLV